MHGIVDAKRKLQFRERDNADVIKKFRIQKYGIGTNDYGQLGTGDNKGASIFVRCVELEK